MADTTLDDALVGQLLERRYRVRSRLAQGGMATVYLALDTRLDRTVALKVMHAELARHDEFVTRFIGEARSAARISHPNVVAVYDQGRDGTRVFLTMEYIAGGTLRDELARAGRLTPRQMWRTMRPVLSALGAAHRLGIVHRDVKPENVLISTDSDHTTVKVADFGLARTVAAEPAVRSGHDSVSSGGMLIGTASYLSPEQVTRGFADTRSDVYSAGVIIFELLTGRKPFIGDDPMEVAQRHVHADVPAPSTLVPDLDPALDALVASATSRDAAARPADADALLAELDRVCDSLSDAALDLAAPTMPLARDGAVLAAAGRERTLAAGVSPHTTVLDDLGTRERTTRVPRTARRARSAAWGAVIVLLAACVLGAGWWVASGRFATTPSVIGLPESTAIARLDHAGLHARLGAGVYSSADPVGTVITESPQAGRRVERDATVTLRLSLGPAIRNVPLLRGSSLSSARTTLAGDGLAVGALSESYDPTVPSGDVISTSPTAGTRVHAGGRVALSISRGPHPVAVPDVVGMPGTAAAGKLLTAGFTVRTDHQQVYSSTVPAGDVTTQSVTGQAQPRTVITLIISHGPQRYAVPNVTGMTVGDAKTALRQAGFTHIDVVALPLVDSNVVAQSPRANSQQPHSATIKLYCD